MKYNIFLMGSIIDLVLLNIWFCEDNNWFNYAYGVYSVRRRGRVHRGGRVQPLAHLLPLYLQDESHQQKQQMSHLQSRLLLTKANLKNIIIMP